MLIASVFRQNMLLCLPQNICHKIDPLTVEMKVALTECIALH